MVDCMKRRTVGMACIVAITISLVVIIAGCTTSTNTTTSPTSNVSSTASTTVGSMTADSMTILGNMAMYQNATVGVQFTYPQNWTVASDPTSNGSDPACYCIIWPNNGDIRLPYPSYVSFHKFSNTDNETLLNVVNSNLQSYIDYGATVVQNVTSTTLGGVPAFKFVVTFNANNNPKTPIERLFICTLKGDSFYTIRYSASTPYYASTLNDVQQIINSFAFI